jgi:hypothetical protein
MLRSVVGWIGVSVAAVVLMGCPKKPGAGGDAGTGDAGPASSNASAEAAAPAAATLGANDADVTKYPDQNADSMEALTTRMEAHARTETGATGGKLVASLKPGTDAQRIADHEGYDLVLFTDPADATRKLEGWVIQSAFGTVPTVHKVTTDGGVAPPTPSTPPAPAATGYVCIKQNPPGKCAAGFSVFAAVCRVPCTTESQCKGPANKCNGGFCYNSMGCGDAP